MPFLTKILVLMLALLANFLPASKEITNLIALGLIVLVGVPHGATDHVLFNIIRSKSMSIQPKLVFIAQYLLIIGAYAVLWWFFPSLALLVFLLVSAYHFGEAQLRYLGAGFLTQAAFLLWGSLVLMIILFLHLDDVKSLLVPYLVDTEVWLFVERSHRYLLAGVGIATVFTLMLTSMRSLAKELPELAMLVIITSNSSLLLSFAIFFVVWHSMEAVLAQIQRIRKLERSFDLGNWIRISTPFTIISILAMAAILIYGLYVGTEIPLLTVFFILIALITLPHAIVMSRFYRS